MTLLLRDLPPMTGIFYAAVAGLGAVLDFRSGKIPNWMTIPATLLALLLAAFCGPKILFGALGGFLVGGLLFVPLFAFEVIGGGDVKLFTALSTVLGAGGALELAMAAILVAGAGSIALLIRHKRVKAFAGEMAKLFRSLVTPGLQIHRPKLRRDIRAPFGIAIFVGYLLVWLR